MKHQTDHQKRYASARLRFLKHSIEQFFKSQLPQQFGPVMREKIADEMVKIIDRQLPKRQFLRPGQCIWNAVSKNTRPDDPHRQLIPVVLTLVTEQEVEQLADNGSLNERASNAVSRMLQEAYEQGALLSMRDIGLLMGKYSTNISRLRKKWEQQHDQLLPHPGSLQDFGSCLTHKVTIIRKVVAEKKDPHRVARETRHSQRAVDNYLKNFNRVKIAYESSNNLDFVRLVTGLSDRLVREYVQILEEIKENA
jgi:hypothetical protein